MAPGSGDSAAPLPEHDTSPEAPDAPEPPPARRRSRSAGVSSAIGAAMVALDEQLMRRIPRAEVLVQRGSQLRGERTGGGDLIVDMPEPLGPPADEDQGPDRR